MVLWHLYVDPRVCSPNNFESVLRYMNLCMTIIPLEVIPPLHFLIFKYQ